VGGEKKKTKKSVTIVSNKDRNDGVGRNDNMKKRYLENRQK